MIPMIFAVRSFDDDDDDGGLLVIVVIIMEASMTYTR
jgi:hypothetical protein